MDNKSSIILFDGECMLCNTFISFMLKKEIDNIFFCDLNSATAKSLLEKFNMPTQNFNTIYLIIDNKIYSKSSAVLKILSHINFFYKIITSISVLFPAFIRDTIYTLVANNRHKLFKSNRCYLPTPNQSKFIMK
jgi:predicted DCC family thiol-disulfide oxidoreductase YuxK